MGRAVLTRRRAALPVWGAYTLLMLLAAVPLFSTVLPPLFDYPNHLARMHLLSEGGNQFYAVHWEPLPNLAQDLIVPPLARLMPLDIASKLFLVAIFGLITGGTIWLNRAATGAWRMWPMLAFLLLYNRIFLWGFLNYLFGIGVALAGAALWLALEGERWWLRTLASSLVAIACYLSHIAAFGVYVLVIIGVELSPAWSELRADRWPALARRTAVAGAQFVIPAALVIDYWHPAAAGGISYAAFWRKADLLFSVFDNYDRAFDIVCFALFLGLIGWLAGTRRLRLAPRLAGAAGLVFAAYLLLPSQIYGGSGADHRLPVAMFLLVIASSAAKFPNRRTAAAVGVVAAVLLVARMALIEYVWLRSDRIYSADLTGIDMLPRGAKLAVAYPASAVNFAPIPKVHLAVLAVARREAFVPTLFANKGQQPITLKPPNDVLADAATPPELWAVVALGGDAAKTGQVLRALQQYDFVAVTGDEPSDVPPTRCLRLLFEQPTFEIFTVLHEASCGSPEG
ncbi:MAG: hypothetical protein JOZ11_06310 [Alphaproteobacteria bacterium]|nr:hypothetical protein [Alphaproteobacteria bacterium]